jgi:hypothetical protein
MNVCVGFEPIGVRQIVAAAKKFTGVLPLVGAVPFVIQDFHANRYDYGTPDGTIPMTKVGDDGGIFRFPEGAIVTEVRSICGAGATLDMYVEEQDGSSSVSIVTATPGAAHRYVMSPEGLPVLPSQQLRILENGIGVPVGVDKSIIVYVVKRGRMP